MPHAHARAARISANPLARTLPACAHLACALLACALLACEGGSREEEVTLAVKAYIDSELELLVETSEALCAAAPAPDADGWSAEADPAEVEAMRAEWRRTRVIYEHIEGAIAVLFPNYDVSTDQRYDGFIEVVPDRDLFDGEIVTGMHAIERILWADQHPPQVIAFESALPNYSPAAFPSSEAEATRFRDQLCARLVGDFTEMRDQFRPLALDPRAAYRGVVGSMAEQQEKVTLAATGEDESRYAQVTLADMRANLEGGRAIYAAFRPWIRDQAGGAEVDREVEAGFGRVEAGYVGGAAAIPEVPEGWNPDAPSSEHLATPYGQLFTLLEVEADPAQPGSLVARMREAAALLRIPLL